MAPAPDGPGPVVALVAAKDMAASVAPTVEALRSVPGVDEVLVVDDGSTDATAEAARQAGASVLRLPANRGKGGAVRAGVDATPHAGTYLLVDADVGPTAAMAERLLAPVVGGEADMAVAVLPAAGKRGGMGLVRRVAAAGIRRATGQAVRAPLSGQRAVRAALLRQLPLAERFGLETAMTIDARRAGARAVEVDVDMDHLHRGRSAAGFRHRAGQGADVVRAVWPRLTSPAQRVTATVAAFALVAAGALWSASRSVPSSVAAAERPAKVVMVAVPGLGLDELGTGSMPNLDALADRGAVAAATVRSLSEEPSLLAGYATLGAGARALAPEAAAGQAVNAGGRVVVPTAAATIAANRREHVASPPGALGDALRRAGLRTAVVGQGALSVMGSDGAVDAGRAGDVGPDAFGTEVAAGLSRADVVLVGPGPGVSADPALGEVVELAGPDALVLVVGVVPPGSEGRLTPMVAVGKGTVPGTLHSQSTRRPGLVTLTDVAPTVLHALGVAVPDAMVGHALRYRPGHADVGQLRSLDRDADLREDLYSSVVFGYIAVQAVVYLLAILGLRTGVFARGRPRWAARLLRLVVVAFSAWPLATFLLDAVPGASRLGGWVLLVLVAIDVVVVAAALQARRHPLSPLVWVCAATMAVLAVDVATGAHLQLSSFLGYSPYTAARFWGLGNAAFAALASCALLVAAVHVHRGPRRAEALVTAGALFALVVVVDGAPGLGSDLGGVLTLVPVFALTLLALTGRQPSWRAVGAAAAVTALAVAGVVGIDLLRAPEARTHLGQLVSRVGEEGLEPLTTTLARKAEGSLRTFASPWSWAIPVVTLYGLYVLLLARGVPELLSQRSALRSGALAMVAAGLLGCALNDSGVVVTAVVFVYIAPFVTLLALHRPDEAVLLEPGPSPADPLLLRR